MSSAFPKQTDAHSAGLPGELARELEPANSYAPDRAPAAAVQNESQHEKLPAVLGMRDLTVFLVLIVLFISNVNGVQFGGPATFVYWALVLITFFIPSAYVTRWLARRYPGQGAPYLWAARVLGANWSFFTAFCAWVPGVLTIVSAIEGGIVFVQYLAPNWFSTPTTQCGAIMLVLVVATAITCLPLRHLKHLLGVLAVLYVGAYLLMGLAGGYWLLQGHLAALSFNAPGSWQPNGSNFAVYGLVVLALLGIDVPLFMGGELRHGKAGVKRASNYVWWGAAISFIAYILGTFGVMAVVSPAQSGAIAANVQAIALVFGPGLGNTVAVVMAASQVTITIAYLLMFSRLLVLVAQDKRLPERLARVNRHGVPVLSIIVQAVVVACVAFLSFMVVPTLFGTLVHPQDLAVEIYNVLLAGAAALWAFSTALLFFFVLTLFYRRQQRAQIGKKERYLLLPLSCIGLVSSLLGVWATVSSSWISALIPDGRWAIFVWAVIVFCIAVGWISSELPRMHALLSEQRSLNDREVALRQQLQEAYREQQVLLAEVNRLYREQAQAAVTDAVTGLPNHRAIMGRIEEELAECQRQERGCAIVFVDLDHFKRVNDTWGHRAGDVILREAGARLRANLREEDSVGRYGGEEFAIVLTAINLDEARQTSERLRASIAARPYLWQSEETYVGTPSIASIAAEVSIPAAVSIEVTASIGIAIYQLHGTTSEELIQQADNAMYQAKRRGRNRVCVAEMNSVLNLHVDPLRPPDPIFHQASSR